MADLPPEIITSNILTRLPAKSLLRFRCVSKAWYTLIDSRDFMKLHLAQTAQTKINRNLMITHQDFSFVSLDSLEITTNQQLPFEFDKSSEAEVYGPCDGLILLHFGSLKRGLRIPSPKRSTLGVWNPSTRSYLQIPSESVDASALSLETFCGGYSETLGLGYDPVHDDYKVVRMIICYAKDLDTFRSEVKVYSLKLNSWKKVHNLPYFLAHRRSGGVYACGAVHWDLAGSHSKDLGASQVKGDLRSFIACFDLATEEHRSLMIPSHLSNDRNGNVLNVEVLEGGLCLLQLYFNRRVDVWVMKDYGVVESWTKLFSVEQPQHIREFKFVCPVAYSKNCREVLLLQDYEKLMWFDLRANVAKEIHARGLPNSFSSLMCVENLVRFGTGKKLREQGKKENSQKGIRKKSDGFLSKGFKLKL